MTIYYVWSGATGANNGLTKADAWTSLQSWYTNAVANDSCRFRGTQTIATPFTYGVNIAQTTPARLWGVDENWDITGERAVIDANSVSTDCVNYDTGGRAMHTYNVELTNAKTDGVDSNSAYQGNSFINCKFSNIGSNAIVSLNVATLSQCLFTGNNNDLNLCINMTVTACMFIASSKAVVSINAHDYSNCIFHDYPTAISATGSVTLVNCTFDKMTVDAVRFTTLNNSVKHCRFTNITGQALDFASAGNTASDYMNNYFYNPAGTDLAGSGLGAAIDLGYNRLTDVNSSDGYVSADLHNFTLTAGDDGTGVAIPIGGLLEEDNIAYITQGMQPDCAGGGGGGRVPRQRIHNV